MAARRLGAEEAMRIALRCARLGLGRSFPNPSVGAAVFRGAVALGRGHTRPAGGAHAEVVALAAAERRHGARALRGASMAVTLEPCCHVGRTGPCTEAVIAAGIRRVYVGCRDPNVLVAGKGMRKLRAAGIEVVEGVLEDECREQHRGFLSACQRGRPFVTLKLAGTLDGRIATASGESRWITGPQARALVHRLRARVDAIAVGSETALADDPELTARRGDRVIRRPVRVLIDSRLRVPPQAKLYRNLNGAANSAEGSSSKPAERSLPKPAEGSRPKPAEGSRPKPAERSQSAEGSQPAEGSSSASTWVLCGRRARGRRAIAATGARLLDTPMRSGHVDLVAGLRRLADEGLTTLLVEGGGELAAALLRDGLVDEIHWMLAPTLLGGDARPALASLEIARLAERVDLRDVRVRRLGADLHIHGRVGSSAADPEERP